MLQASPGPLAAGRLTARPLGPPGCLWFNPHEMLGPRHILVATAALSAVAAIVVAWGPDQSASSAGPAEPLEHAMKRAQARPTAPALQPIDQVAAAAHAPLEAWTAVPAAGRARLLELAQRDGSPPLLLPERPDLLETAQVVIGPHWYTVSMKGQDFGVVVSGNSASIYVPGMAVAPEAAAAPEAPRITRVHDIVTLSFAAWGAAYDMDIECLGGVEHPLCGDDLLAFDLLATLRHIGGDR